MSQFFKVILTFSVVFITALALPSQAQAITKTSVETCSIGLQRTDWNQNCELKQFNTSLGELKKVSLEYKGYIEGLVKIENKDATTKSVSTNYQTNLKLVRNDNVEMVTVPLSLGFTQTLPAYDNTTDYAGTSGMSSPKLTNETAKSLEYTGGDLDRFRGSGTVRFPASATGTMTINGSSNAAADWDTFAKATLTVTYTYEGKDLSIRKTHTGDVYNKGDEVVFSFTITNEDSSDYSGKIELRDSLPVELRFVSGGGNGWNCSDSAVCWIDNASLSSGAKTSFTMKTKLSDSANGVITNKATIFPNGDVNSANNTATDWVTVGQKAPVNVAKPITPRVLGLTTCNTNEEKGEAEIQKVRLSASTAQLTIATTPQGCGKVQIEYGTCAEGLKNKQYFEKTEDSQELQAEISGLSANSLYSFRARCVNSCEQGDFGKVLGGITNKVDDSCPKIYSDSLQTPTLDTSSKSCVSSSATPVATAPLCPAAMIQTSSEDRWWFWLVLGFAIGNLFFGLLLRVPKLRK